MVHVRNPAGHSTANLDSEGFMRSPATHTLYRSAVVLWTAWLGACGDANPVRPDPNTPPPPPPPPAVASVRLPNGPLALNVGQSTQLTAMPLSDAGVELPDRTVTWSSTNASVATVSGNGTVTAMANGTASIIATSENRSAHIRVGVAPLPAVSVRLDKTVLNKVEGQFVVLNAVVLDAQGRELDDRPITWTSLDESVAAVTTYGLVMAVGEGDTQIIASHGALSQSANITVTAYFGGLLMFDVLEPLPSSRRLFRIDPRDTDAHPQPILAHPGAWDADVSSAAQRIVFVCTTPGPAICSADIDGSDLRVLTDGDTSDEDQPVWSPDGRHIAFRRWPHGATPGPFNPTDIWIMNADGSSQRNLTADAKVQRLPSWSPVLPDGSTRVVFTQESVANGYQTSRLYTMRPDGSDRRPLTRDGDHVDEEAAWSPDGTWVAFTRSGGAAQGDVVLVNVITGAERTFLAHELAGAQKSPAWSPNGRFLAFTSNHEPVAGQSQWQIYTARVDGTHVKRRTSGSGDKENLGWLPFQ